VLAIRGDALTNPMPSELGCASGSRVSITEVSDDPGLGCRPQLSVQCVRLGLIFVRKVHKGFPDPLVLDGVNHSVASCCLLSQIVAALATFATHAVARALQPNSGEVHTSSLAQCRREQDRERLSQTYSPGQGQVMLTVS